MASMFSIAFNANTGFGFGTLQDNAGIALSNRPVFAAFAQRRTCVRLARHAGGDGPAFT